MNKPSKYGVLVCGVLAPFAALVLYILVYGVLTRSSADPQKDWLFRLSCSTLALMVPGLATLGLALRQRRLGALSRSSKIGLGVAILSLGLTAQPISSGVTRWKQVRNQAMRGVAAPLFDTPDLAGKLQRLADYRGQVVLVNRWATWCQPCRAEMPKLDDLFQKRKEQGFMVFGMSDEEAALQQKFLQEVHVTYPLLSLKGNVPSFYRDITRYPANFLIDRQGRLQPVPGPEEPFSKMEATVDALLNQGAP